jgi:hypothetical protein
LPNGVRLTGGDSSNALGFRLGIDFNFCSLDDLLRDLLFFEQRNFFFLLREQNVAFRIR